MESLLASKCKKSKTSFAPEIRAKKEQKKIRKEKKTKGNYSGRYFFEKNL